MINKKLAVMVALAVGAALPVALKAPIPESPRHKTIPSAVAFERYLASTRVKKSRWGGSRKSGGVK